MNFKFELGAKVYDKDMTSDKRLIVGRVLDSDDNNKPLYITKNNGGHVDWVAAKSMEENFLIAE